MKKVEDFGPVEAEFLSSEISKIFSVEGEFEFVDNERLCLEGDSEGEAEYHEEARNGCCGFFDTRLGPSPSGKYYMFGFNHGH